MQKVEQKNQDCRNCSACAIWQRIQTVVRLQYFYASMVASLIADAAGAEIPRFFLYRIKCTRLMRNEALGYSLNLKIKVKVFLICHSAIGRNQIFLSRERLNNYNFPFTGRSEIFLWRLIAPITPMYKLYRKRRNTSANQKLPLKHLVSLTRC